MKPKEKEIKITDVEYVSRDEVYCDWYKCLNCKDDMITENQNYCGNCGSKLKWSSPL